jgi:hypothetical protein
MLYDEFSWAYATCHKVGRCETHAYDSRPLTLADVTPLDDPRYSSRLCIKRAVDHTFWARETYEHRLFQYNSMECNQINIIEVINLAPHDLVAFCDFFKIPATLCGIKNRLNIGMWTLNIFVSVIGLRIGISRQQTMVHWNGIDVSFQTHYHLVPCATYLLAYLRLYPSTFSMSEWTLDTNFHYH